MKELLFEIGVEEIPSNLIPYGMKKMEELAVKLFKENRLEFEGIETYGTPRRLILYVPQLAEKQTAFSEEITGPPKKISFDESGKLTQAGVKFAQAQGVSPGSLKVKTTPKGEYLCVLKKKKELQTGLLLKTALPQLIQSLSFPKSMTWSPSKIRFVRPIRWMAALYGGKTIPFKLGEIKSGGSSYGHRFLAPKPFKAGTFAFFKKQLRKKFVIIDPEERRKEIQKTAIEMGKSCGGKTEIREDILDQAVYMVEYPVVFRGGFEKAFLKLPKEIIINAMCEHQGYFPVLTPAGDQLLPYFVAVSNMKVPQMGMIQKGNERVLRSRLSDAQFYYESDLDKKLADRVEDLKKVVYQESLGSQYERSERLSGLCGRLAEWTAPGNKRLRELAVRGGRLSKADLLTGVVREFPKLQGVMGREYALLQNEPPEIADALSEQYLPGFSGDILPQSPLGRMLSMADKMDAITGSFGVGLIPTGSEDPYALRRQAAGLIQIMLTCEPPSPFSVEDLIDASAEQYQSQKKFNVDVKSKVAEFLKQRYAFILVSQGYRPDLIEAVISVDFNDLLIGLKKVEALTRFSLKQKAVFEALQALYKRMNNIVPKGFNSAPADPGLFKTEEEKDLEATLKSTEEEIEALKKTKDEPYASILNLLPELKDRIDNLFNAVMVNDPDEALKKNRLAMLHHCLNLLRKIADFSKINAEC